MVSWGRPSDSSENPTTPLADACKLVVIYHYHRDQSFPPSCSPTAPASTTEAWTAGITLFISFTKSFPSPLSEPEDSDEPALPVIRFAVEEHRNFNTLCLHFSSSLSASPPVM